MPEPIPMPVPMPESEKVLACQAQTQICGEFLEWLSSEKNVRLAVYHTHNGECYDKLGQAVCDMNEDSLQPIFFSISLLLAEFFKLDMAAVERERRALLEQLSQEIARISEGDGRPPSS